MIAPDSKFRSRKYSISLLFTLMGGIALFLDKMGGGEFVALATTVTMMYGAANVGEKYVENGK